MNEKVDRYWKQYIDSLSPKADRPGGFYESFSFGTSPQDADDIVPLVLAGTKTATGSLEWTYDSENRRIPQEGDLSIVLDGSNSPVCIIKTTEVRVIPFDEVDEAFAYDAGEHDKTLASWRQMYQV